VTHPSLGQLVADRQAGLSAPHDYNFFGAIGSGHGPTLLISLLGASIIFGTALMVVKAASSRSSQVELAGSTWAWFELLGPG
jgi:hypothetical protein